MLKIFHDNLTSGELVTSSEGGLLLRVDYNGRVYEHRFEGERPTVGQLANAITDLKIPHGPNGGALLKFSRKILENL